MVNPELNMLIGRIRDRSLRKKVAELVRNPSFRIDDKTYRGIALDEAPAGLSHHHAYPGGFIEHVVSSANVALTLCDSVEKIYHGSVNRDLVVAGVLLHDIFKPVTYVANEDGTYDSTRLADYMDHTSLAVSELVRRDLPLELVHIVAAHMGSYGPIRPRSVEALIVHVADLADSRLNGEVLSAANYLTRRAVGQELRGLTSKEAFEIVRSKSIEGWEGVRDSVEKIEHQRIARKT